MHGGGVSAKLHYTDTGYGHVVQHHQRTSSKQVVDVQPVRSRRYGGHGLHKRGVQIIAKSVAV